MLISRVEDERCSEGGQEEPSDHAHEYQTASELFDMMAKNHPFEDVNETLSARDLVILYKNIDLGTKLMSNAEEYKLAKKPNQRVETIVCNDEDSEDSDISEIYSKEELQEVFKVNRERIDLLNSGSSLENTLCQKFGDLEIQASTLSLQYDQHFLFKDPYIKEQLKNFSQVDKDFDGAFPASLLDYICCKRLEDNYNFYMDNIIRYVKHTIEHLKRISNGDYLTDKAREKWREVDDVAKDDDNTKVFAASTSLPLQVERKINGLTTTWDDIIHSEVDIRSLSKILEKKIVVEVPKLICGSYKLFSKFCADNLVISCKKEQQIVLPAEKESRVNVVLQLGRSETGHVVSNISSIMILQPASPVFPVECPKILSLPYKEEISQNEADNVENNEVKIVEIAEAAEIKKDANDNIIETCNDVASEEMDDDAYPNDDTEDDNSIFKESKTDSMFGSSDSSVALRDILDTRAVPDIMRKEAPYNFISPEDLSLSRHQMNMSSLPEEAGEDMLLDPANKKKSITKIRIKSPYENKSYLMEEKKRKKLLEIREKREKKKMAVGEKITKHRYGKGAMPLQSVNSVTKLSITNKSFYNSIYGHNMNLEQSTKSKGRRGKRELSLDMSLDQLDGEHEAPLLTPEKNSMKYINRSYYLDDAVTAMMYTELKQSECSSVREIFSGSTSVKSGDYNPNVNIVTQIIDSAKPNFNQQVNSPQEDKDSLNEEKLFDGSSKPDLESNGPVPTNSPENGRNDNVETGKGLASVKCRKSIDKLYNLIKNMNKPDPLEVTSSRSKVSTSLNKTDSPVGQENHLVQGSDSGTSLKHHLTSSNPSSFSFDKMNSDEINASKIASNKKSDLPTTVVPKVIISSRQQTLKMDAEKMKKDRKKVIVCPVSKMPDNPLKAISQLLHEFDNVQKIRHKPQSDVKPIRKITQPEVTFENRNTPRQGFSKRRPRSPGREGKGDKDARDRERRENEIMDSKNVKLFVMKERRPKTPRQQIPHEDRQIDRATKKKIADIIDEVKEAKGEAVRGPAKPNSRLNTLAQPKKSYVQAHSEEYQTKYGRNLMADRLQRLAATPATRGRPRRGTEVAVAALSGRPPPVQALDRSLRPRRSAGSSPDGKPPEACKRSHATDAPDTLKHKMVAVETYVKSHYRRLSPPTPASELLKARVPLVPKDLDLGSLQSTPTDEGSASIGSKLHHIICSMVKQKPHVPLGAVLEMQETTSKASQEKANEDELSLLISDDHSPGRPSSIDSDYRTDIFEDKNVKTAVQTFQDQTEEPAAEEELEKGRTDTRARKNQGELANSSVELQKLEEAFQGRLSVGTFQKRLRIKNLTLTPKSSIQKALALESGDTGPIVVKSTLSKSLKISNSRSEESLQMLANLRSAHFDWKFSNVPMQVATVGYAFPDHNSSFGGHSPAIKSLDNIFNLGISACSTSTRDKMSNKTSQCFISIPESHYNYDMQELSVVSEKKELTTVSVATDAYVNHEVMYGDCTDFKDVKNCLFKVEELNMKANPESVDCTSSLDMLVGLLNEIQKITTCHMANTDIYASEQECKELETMLCNEAAMKEIATDSDSRELVSITSLEKLRQLEFTSSIYSLYLSTDDDKDSIVNSKCLPRLKMSAKSMLYNYKPICVDKEVSADIPVKEYMDTVTDVPSKIFPITVTHSTNISNSPFGFLSKSPSQTLISLQDATYIDKGNVIEIARKTRPKVRCMSIIEYPNTGHTQKCKDTIVEEKITSKLPKVATQMKLFADDTKCYVKSYNIDPMLKMKRDILVTVYSMLVLTVFAALSFPEILYHV